MNWFDLSRKIMIRFFLLLSEIAKEYHYLFFKKKQDRAFEKRENEDTRFIKINHAYWAQKELSLEKGIILIEGFFAQSGNNYLLRTGMLAKAIQEKTKLTPAVIFDKAAFKLIAAKRKYHSFGIGCFIYIKPSIVQCTFFLCAIAVSLKFYLKLKEVKDILRLSYNGILFGDLIHDDLLKFNKNCYTLSSIDLAMLKVMIRSFCYYFSYTHIFKRKKINYLVSTHSMYIQYGILVRVALRYGANVIETNDLIVNSLSAKDWKDKIISPTLHDVIKKTIEKILGQGADKKELINFARINLGQRFSGEIEQFDVRFAYKNKIAFKKESFRERLKISNEKPFVIVFAHVFADAPHSSPFLLFGDYYQWLTETLKEIAKIKEINWLVKPHPSARVYNEQGIVEDLILNATHNEEAPNIFLFPSEVSTSNLNEIVEAVVTVHGTAGIEFSSLGLPVILAGRPFYAEEGFTYEPKTKDAYFELLRNVNKIPMLTTEQILKAQVWYGAYMRLMTKSDIISQDALDEIWGYAEGGVNIELGNKKINDNLQCKDPREEFQYKKVKEYVESALI